VNTREKSREARLPQLLDYQESRQA